MDNFKKQDDALQFQFDFQKMICDISSKFVNANPRTFDDAVNFALRLSGEFFNVDRSYLFQFSTDGDTMDNTHEWCNKDVAPQIDRVSDISLNNFPWITSQIKSNDHIQIPDISRLPLEAESEKTEFQKQDIKSLLMLRLLIDGKALGFIGYDFVKKKKKFTSEQISLLKLLAETISMSLNKNRTEKELEKSELQYRTLVANVPGVIYRCANDPQWTIFYISDKIKELSGYNAPDFILNKERSFASIIHPDDQQMVIKIINEAISKKTSHKLRYRIINSRGEIKWFYESGQGVFDNKGNLLYIDGLIVDISERKRIDDKLKNVSERLELATVAANIGIWDMDLVKKRLYWDDTMYRLYGITSGNYLIKYDSWNARIHAEDRPRIIRATEEALSGKRTFDTEFRVVWPDASVKYIKAYATVQFDDKNNAIRMVGVNWDITAQRETAENLKTFRTALDNSADNIFIIDPDKMIFLDVNETACHDTGYSREELLNMGPQDIKPYFTVKELSEEFKKVINGNKGTGIIETFHQRKNLTEYPVEVFLQVFYSNRKPLLVASVRDITKRKEYEEELAKYTSEIELKNVDLENARNAALEASKAKSHFLATMSHEIRTPMNSILGMADLLAETPLNREQEGYVQIFRKAGETLLELINDILDISRIEAGQIKLTERDFSLIELIENATALVSPKAKDKGLELLCRIHPDVTENLSGDSDRLRQVLVNLLANAIKFTPEGEVVIEVKQLNGGEKTPEIIFYVKDTGIGIPENQLENIFEEFIQLDCSNTRAYEGSGLGLNISRHLVKLMGGELKVISDLGKGSTFYFSVPFRASREKPVTKVRENYDLNLEGIRVLIVDDNETNRLILKETLIPKGAIIYEADNADAALKELKKSFDNNIPYHLLLADVMMPGKDGYQLTEEVRKMNRHLPVILLSSAPESKQNLLYESLNIDAFLIKPVKREIIFNTIKKSLEKYCEKNLIKEKICEEMDKKISNKQINELPSDKTEAAAKDPLGDTDTLPALKILVVEDNMDNRMLVEAFLKKTPHLLDFAENGANAVKMAQENKYALILMDIQMPVMDGYTATKKIREWENKNNLSPTPIIALTAYALKNEIQKAMDAGCDNHLAKPVKKATLIDTISQYNCQ